MTKTVTLGARTVLLVGTAHVSEQSVRDVREAIATQQPDCVCVELDAGRYATISQQRNWMELDIRRVLKQRKGFLLLTNIVLHSFQRRLAWIWGCNRVPRWRPRSPRPRPMRYRSRSVTGRSR